MTLTLKPDWTTTPTPFRHTWTGVVNIDQFRWLVRRDTQEQLAMAVDELGARHVRAVGIFDDEMRFFTLTPTDWKNKERHPKINFQLIDYVVDSLLELGLAPMITTCFMPSALAAGDKTVFTTKGRISLPKDWKKWEGLIQNTVRHCVERYGIDVVRQWYFEVWNEPNLKDNFFEGTYDDFLALWHATYTAIKSVDSQLRVGGPSTARAEWIEPFLQWTRNSHCMPDYMIVHIYNNDSEFGALSPFEGPQEDKSGKSPNYAARVITGTRSLLDKLDFKGEVHWNEWGRTWHPTDPLRETSVEAAWIVKTMSEVSQSADYFAYWCVSDIYDQVGYVSTTFEQHYGMLNVQGLRKPSWHAHQLLSRLGRVRLPAEMGQSHAEIGAIVTKEDERGAILLHGIDSDPLRHEIKIIFPREAVGKRLTLTALNERDNNTVTRWAKMGSPAYLTKKQLSELQENNRLVPLAERPIVKESSDGGEVSLEFQTPGLLLIEW